MRVCVLCVPCGSSKATCGATPPSVMVLLKINPWRYITCASKQLLDYFDNRNQVPHYRFVPREYTIHPDTETHLLRKSYPGKWAMKKWSVCSLQAGNGDLGLKNYAVYIITLKPCPLFSWANVSAGKFSREQDGIPFHSTVRPKSMELISIPFQTCSPVSRMTGRKETQKM